MMLLRLIRRGGRRLAAVSLLAVALGWPGIAQSTVVVPIKVDRNVPANANPGEQVYGQEVVSLGVPFSIGDSVTSIKTPVIYGVTRAQFKVLERDPEKGKITWMRATFEATPGSTYYLSTIGGAAYTDSLATTSGDTIFVKTGEANFNIKKARFNFINYIYSSPTVLVKRHLGKGGIVAVANDTLFSSVFDSLSATTIEENGPVMATIKSVGILKSATGSPLFDYTCRMHFYRDKRYVRAFVTLQNARENRLKAVTFTSARVEIPRMQLSGSKTITMPYPRGRGAWVDPMTETTAYVFQAKGSYHYDPNNYGHGIDAALTTLLGMEAKEGSTEYVALGNPDLWCPGWLRIEDATKCYMAGMRDMAETYPSAVDIRNDSLSVEMFARRNGKTLTFSWGAHDTREILIDFTTPSSSWDRFSTRLNYPVVGIPSYEYLRSKGALFGETRLVTTEEEQLFYADQGYAWYQKPLYDPSIRYPRYRDYSTGYTGDSGFLDADMGQYLDFLRGEPSSFGGWYQEARMVANFRADQSIVRSDDFDYSTYHLGSTGPTIPVSTGAFNGVGVAGQANIFDDHYSPTDLLIAYWHLSGDQRIKDALTDYYQWRYYRASTATTGFVFGGTLDDQLGFGKVYRDMAFGYLVTGTDAYLARLIRMTRTLVDDHAYSCTPTAAPGRDDDRGFFYYNNLTSTFCKLPLLQTLIETQANAGIEALKVIRQQAATDTFVTVTTDVDTLSKSLGDYLEGLARFTVEAQVTREQIGYPGDYDTGRTPLVGICRPQTGPILAYGYEATADTTFLYRMRDLTYGAASIRSNGWPPEWSETYQQARMYRWINQDVVGFKTITPDWTKEADSTYVLTWAAPLGASSYRVKSAILPIVENYDFNAASRAWMYDPDSTAAFWSPACTEIWQSITPSAMGEIDTLVTPALNGVHYFAVRASTDKQDIRIIPKKRFKPGGGEEWSPPE